MSTYIMSDIHGCLRAYRLMLEKIEFSDTDHLYIIGDVIDRGEDGITILRDIMNRKNVTMLLGNHERMMLDALSELELPEDEYRPHFEHWCINGSSSTLDQLSELSEDEFFDIIGFLLDLKVRMDIEVNGRKFHLVHGVPGDKDASEEDLIWGRAGKYDEPYYADRTVISGHTPTFHYHDDGSTDMWHGNGVIVIDCGCFIERVDGKLGCLRLDDMQEFYTSQY